MVTTKTLLTSTEYLCHKSHVCSVCRTHNHVSSSLVTYHMVCDKSNMTGATSGTGTVPSELPEYNPGFYCVPSE